MIESSKKLFNKNIDRILELLEHEVFVVMLDKKVTCTCLQEGTSQADPTCDKCLGTGFKIKIRKCMAASQDSSVPSTIRNASGFVISRNYYIRFKDKLNNDDVIIDGDEIYFVFQAPSYSAFDGEKVYQKCSAMPKKLDAHLFFKHFNKIVGR